MYAKRTFLKQKNKIKKDKKVLNRLDLHSKGNLRIEIGKWQQCHRMKLKFCHLTAHFRTNFQKTGVDETL